MTIFKCGLNVSHVESSKCDNSFESAWMFSHVELEGTRKEAFNVDFSTFHCLSRENGRSQWPRGLMRRSTAARLL
jgi:hypothetical protein